MHNKIILITLVFLLVVIISFMFVNSADINSIKLYKGKNNILFNLSSDFYVKDLVRLNPKIETISYKYENETFGYVNVFSGIGENFKIISNKDYEIIVKDDINLILPYEK